MGEQQIEQMSDEALNDAVAREVMGWRDIRPVDEGEVIADLEWHEQQNPEQRGDTNDTAE